MHTNNNISSVINTGKEFLFDPRTFHHLQQFCFSTAIPNRGSSSDIPTNILKSTVLICDDYEPFLVLAKNHLNKAGFRNVSLCQCTEEASALLSEVEPDLILIDIYLDGENGFDFVKSLRGSGYTGLIAMISADFSLEVVEKAVWSGTDDFFIKNKKLSITTEVGRILEKRRLPRDAHFFSSTLEESAFLRCIGLTNFEFRLLQACYPSFPSQKELAFNFNKSSGYIRKTFSSIYNKFQVNGQAQLARMLTFCSRFSRLTASQDCTG